MKTFIFTLAGIFFISYANAQLMKRLINPISNGTEEIVANGNSDADESVWEKVYQLPAQQMPVGIDIVDENTIWIHSIFYNWITPPKDEQYFYRSIDGGVNWNKMEAPGQLVFSAIDSLNVWASVQNTGVIKTSDGGKTWDTLFVTDRWGPIHFFNANEGILVACFDSINEFSTADSIVIYRTTDGGLNWSMIDAADYGGNIKSEACVSVNDENMSIYGDTLYFGTTRNRIIYTTNKGENWKQMVSPFENPNETLIGIQAKNNLNITVISSGYMTSLTDYYVRPYPIIAFTTNGGETWTENTCLNLSSIAISAIVPGSDSISYMAAYQLEFGSGGTMISKDYGDTYTLIDSLSNIMVMRFLNASLGFAATFNYNDPRFSNTDYILKWKPGVYPEKKFWRNNTSLPYSCKNDTTTVSTCVKNSFSLFPNPCSGMVNFLLPLISTEKCTIQIYDYTGRQILTQTVSPCRMGETVSIDLSKQPTGIYLVRLKVGGEEFFGKIMLVK